MKSTSSAPRGLAVLAAALLLAFAFSACQSTPPSAIPSDEAAPAASRYRRGVADSGLTEPPAALKAIMDQSSGAAPAKGSLPLYADGILSFAIKAPGASGASLFMTGLQDGESDALLPYEADGWFWRSYSMPGDAPVAYLYKTMDSSGDFDYPVDPVNPGVRATPPYWNVWKPAGASRLELLELPYELPGRDKPQNYSVKSRRMLIYVPAGYDADVAQRYPVIYMQDGQNAWDSTASNWGGWKADKVMDELIASGAASKAIIVSIFNNGYRTEEYAGAGVTQASGGADQRPAEIAAYYRDWCISVLKPQIDKTYRTLPDRANTAVLGSSYGGCIAIYWGMSKPEVFGRVASISYAPGDERDYGGGMTSLTKDTYLPALKKAGTPKPRIWLDCGTSGLDGTLSPFSKVLDQVLLGAGYAQGADYHFELFPGEDHNEAAWYRRLPQILKFLLPTEK